jgi:hypothetical protein
MNERLKELAVQAGAELYGCVGNENICVNGKDADGLMRAFAELVRQDLYQVTGKSVIEQINSAIQIEREACAMECIKIASSWARLGAWGTKTDFHECATAIRARGEPSPAFKNFLDDKWAGIV